MNQKLIFNHFLTNFLKEDNKNLLESLHKGFSSCFEGLVPIENEIKLDVDAIDLLKQLIQHTDYSNDELSLFLSNEGASALANYVNVGVVLDLEHKKEILKELASYSAAFEDSNEPELAFLAKRLMDYFYRK